MYRIFSIKRPRRLIEICSFDQAFSWGRRLILVGRLLMKYNFLYSCFFLQFDLLLPILGDPGAVCQGGTTIFPFVLSLDLRAYINITQSYSIREF